MAPKFIERPHADMRDANTTIELPYGIDVEGIIGAINDLYAYLHAINRASIECRYDRLEDVMLEAAFSGLLSEIMVRALSARCNTRKPGLTRNLQPGGHPDLIPRARWEGDRVHQGDEGIEIKTTRNPTSIQSHNEEAGWFCVVEFSCDIRTLPVHEREPTIIQRVTLAKLLKSDWKFSGRSATSRRTPTASITKTGRAKLDAGILYMRDGVDGYKTYRADLAAGKRARKPAKREAKTPAEKHQQPPAIEQ